MCMMTIDLHTPSAERWSRRDDEVLSIHLEADLIAALDRFIAEEAPAAPRPDALKIAFRQWAESRGYVVQPLPDQGKHPSELTAENDG